MQDGFEEGPVLHAEGDLVQVEGVHVLPAKQGQHFLTRAVLGHILPGRGIQLAWPGDDVEGDGPGGGDEFLVLRDVDGKWANVPGSGK